MITTKYNKAKHFRFARTHFVHPCLRRYDHTEIQGMKTLFTILLSIILFGCSNDEYKCFYNSEYKNEMLCYDHLKHASMDGIAKSTAKNLFQNIDNPQEYIKAEGELANRYTDEKLANSISKGYSGKTENDILDIISTEGYSAVYLKTGETLYFKHSEKVFVFDYKSPAPFEGAEPYFGNDHMPVIKKLKLDESKCNIDNGDIVFLSPEKQSEFYNKEKSFCSYHGMALFKENGSFYAWPYPKEDGSWNTENDYSSFSDFLYWLKSNHNKSSKKDAVSGAPS